MRRTALAVMKPIYVAVCGRLESAVGDALAVATDNVTLHDLDTSLLVDHTVDIETAMWQGVMDDVRGE